ncbi:probable F-box protein At5g04010 [Macadamia integrifolia]|uniref:probable F-box protein At5g04010 n=1 Tax=Macadamia integrifolia TaxID=60698 RepID=UPI001C4EF94B|nr:probable F-box protein At5g04010 [Macadamia integrifolia]
MYSEISSSSPEDVAHYLERISESCKFPTYSSSNHLSPPPWEVLVLVSHYLDPKTLAIASCVCKSWSISMSLDDLWKPPINQPSVAILAHLAYPIDDLVFAIEIFDIGSCRTLVLTNDGRDLDTHRRGVFRFEVDVQSSDVGARELSTEMMVVTWPVVLKGWKGIFSMMVCKVKGMLVPGGEKWFTEELPAPGCCVYAGASGLVSELGLGFSDGSKMRRVEKVSIGIMNIGSCRYLSVDDGLRYLQQSYRET